MNNNNFYTPQEILPLYDEIVPAYQEAFASAPWSEVSKCEDEKMRCIGGFSATAIGSLCSTCGLCPELPAYESDELTNRFDALGLSRPTAWYTEQNEQGLTMAAVAWQAKPIDIANEKYSDGTEMGIWMSDMLGDEPVMWLDEVFANKQLKPTGNLQNFGSFVIGLAARLDCETIAYRTIEPRMTAAAKRDLGEDAIVSIRNEQVPDWRDFVIISNLKEAI